MRLAKKMTKQFNPRPQHLLASVTFILVTCFQLATGFAQQPPPTASGVSVFQRARPDYDPLGIRARSFLIFPSFQIAETYNDNIFATQHNTDGDFITVLSPQIRAQSDWGNHALNLAAGADAGFYADHTDENFVDGRVAADGRLDVLRGTYLVGGTGWQHLHEERGNPDAANGKTPTEYELYTANLGAVRARGVVSARLDTNFNRLKFHNVDAAGGGHIEETQRDRDVYSVAPRVGYEYLPNTEAFVRLIGSWTRYDQTNTADDRSNNAYAIQVGTDLNFTNKTSGEVHVGFQHTDFERSQFQSVNAPSIGGSVLWNVTELTSILGVVSVTTQETTQTGASAYVAYRAGAEVQHELLRNLLIGGGFTLGDDDYQGISRTDYLAIANLTARYLINRNFFAGADYFLRGRSSDGSSDDYLQNIFLVRLGAQL